MHYFTTCVDMCKVQCDSFKGISCNFINRRVPRICKLSHPMVAYAEESAGCSISDHSVRQLMSQTVNALIVLVVFDPQPAEQPE